MRPQSETKLKHKPCRKFSVPWIQPQLVVHAIVAALLGKEARSVYLLDKITNRATLANRPAPWLPLTTWRGADSSAETNLAPATCCHYSPTSYLPEFSVIKAMRALFATACLALTLAGCRGTGEGLFGQMIIPPPGTQPSGTLLADNSYYPGPTPNTAVATILPTTPAAPASRDVIKEPSFASSGNSQPAERRGASLSRSSLATPTRPVASPSREEPIRIPNESPAAGALAAVVPIRGIPTTDATSLFDTVRAQLTPRSSLVARAPASSGFVEISQLPDAPAALRRAALSGQSLR